MKQLSVVHILQCKFIVCHICKLVKSDTISVDLIWGLPLPVPLPVLIISLKSLLALHIIRVFLFVLDLPCWELDLNSIWNIIFNQGSFDIIFRKGFFISADSHIGHALTSCRITTIIAAYIASYCTEFIALASLKNTFWYAIEIRWHIAWALLALITHWSTKRPRNTFKCQEVFILVASSWKRVLIMGINIIWLFSLL